jgi:hypothetical protein
VGRKIATLQRNGEYDCGMSRDPIQDTSSRARQVQIEVLRRLTPTQKLALVDDACRLTRISLVAGLRQRHPGACDAEIERRLMGLLLGEDLAAAAFGPLASTKVST